MASRCPEPDVEPHGVTASGGCRRMSPPAALASREGPALGLGPFQGLPAPEGQGSCRRRNVLTERQRRKRIAASCERLRALLPWFDCRREDMASVLEMAVQFLRLAHTLVPAQGQHMALAPPREACHHRWPRKALQVVLGSQAPVSVPDSGMGALGLARPREPPHGVPLGVDGGAAPLGLAEVLGGPPAHPGQQASCEQGCGFASLVGALEAAPNPGVDRAALPPSGGSREDPSLPLSEPPDPSVSRTLGGQAPGPLCPPWAAPSQQPASQPLSPAAQSWPGPATEGTNTGTTSAPDTRSVPGPEVEEGMALLLAAGPDWWPGSLEGLGGGTPAPPDRTEPGSLADTGPGFQELQDNLLEQWGPDLGCAGLALREEADSLFPDLFACHL